MTTRTTLMHPVCAHGNRLMQSLRHQGPVMLNCHWMPKGMRNLLPSWLMINGMWADMSKRAECDGVRDTLNGAAPNRKTTEHGLAQ